MTAILAAIGEAPALLMGFILAILALAVSVENYPKRPAVTGECCFSYAQAKAILAHYHSRRDTFRCAIVILLSLLAAIVARLLALALGAPPQF